MKNPNEHIQLYYVNEGKVIDGKFVKTPNTHPVGTVALAWLSDPALPPDLHRVRVARGISICGEKDQFSRANGRRLAIKRARKALYTGSFGIQLQAGKTTNKFWDCLAEMPETEIAGSFNYASEPFVDLTEYEEKLLAIYVENNTEPRAKVDKFDKFVEEVHKVTKATKVAKVAKVANVKKEKAKVL